MKLFKRTLMTVTVVAAFAAEAPAAHANSVGGGGVADTATCGVVFGDANQSGVAGVYTQVCQGGGVTGVGQAAGQQAFLAGPTIAPGSVTGGPVIAAAGNVTVQVGSL